MSPGPSGPVAGFEHDCLVYSSAEGFLSGVGGFVRAGLADGAAVVVAEPRPRLELLRGDLGADADAVTWLDMAEIGGNPARIIDVWAGVLDDAVAAGRPLRGVGEPAFAGRRPAELVECALLERLLDRAFWEGPAWQLLCPYDEAALPAAVCEQAVAGHATGGSDDEDLAAFAAALPPPPGPVLRGEYGAGDVPAVRHTVRQWARSCGLQPEQVEALELAASELATNGVRHGGGGGSLAMWVDTAPDQPAAVCELTDAGHLTEPLTGRLRPSPDAEGGGRGLYLVNQLCDLVQLRSSAAGTTARLLAWLP